VVLALVSGVVRGVVLARVSGVVRGVVLALVSGVVRGDVVRALVSGGVVGGVVRDAVGGVVRDASPLFAIIDGHCIVRLRREAYVHAGVVVIVHLHGVVFRAHKSYQRWHGVKPPFASDGLSSQ
ncbi:hypothetical protein AURDEDRAFT_178660, partial [Auricularia subglabra TFB-10046 SS5]